MSAAKDVPADSEFPIIPVVNISALLSEQNDVDIEAMQEVSKAIQEACETSGFMCVMEHGVSSTTKHKALDAIQQLFDSDDAIKSACEASAASKWRGYTRVGGGHNCLASESPELKESFTIGAVPAADADTSPMHAVNQWPDIHGFRYLIETLWKEMMTLSHALAKGLALALDKPVDWFADRMQNPVAQMVSFRYPPANGKGKAVGCGEHTDCGFLTMVLQNDVAGLEVFVERKNEWVLVCPMEDAIVVNIGDLAARWSNEHFVSTTHRVYNRTDRTRYSIAFFCNADFNANVECICKDGEPPKYPPIQSGHYLQQKLGLMHDTTKS